MYKLASIAEIICNYDKQDIHNIYRLHKIDLSVFNELNTYINIIKDRIFFDRDIKEIYTKFTYKNCTISISFYLKAGDLLECLMYIPKNIKITQVPQYFELISHGDDYKEIQLYY